MAPQPKYFNTFFSNPNDKKKKCETIKNHMVSCLRDPLDKTRDSQKYDPTWNYLREIGLDVI